MFSRSRASPRLATECSRNRSSTCWSGGPRRVHAHVVLGHHGLLRVVWGAGATGPSRQRVTVGKMRKVSRFARVSVHPSVPRDKGWAGQVVRPRGWLSRGRPPAAGSPPSGEVPMAEAGITTEPQVLPGGNSILDRPKCESILIRDSSRNSGSDARPRSAPARLHSARRGGVGASPAAHRRLQTSSDDTEAACPPRCRRRLPTRIRNAGGTPRHMGDRRQRRRSAHDFSGHRPRGPRPESERDDNVRSARHDIGPSREHRRTRPTRPRPMSSPPTARSSARPPSPEPSAPSSSGTTTASTACSSPISRSTSWARPKPAASSSPTSASWSASSPGPFGSVICGYLGRQDRPQEHCWPPCWC